LTPANLRNFTRRDEPGQIPRTKKTPIFHPPKTPARTKLVDATVATRGTSSDVGRRPFVKSTVIQQTEGLACGEMIYGVERGGGVGEGESTEQPALRIRTFIKEGAGRAGCLLGREYGRLVRSPPQEQIGIGTSTENSNTSKNSFACWCSVITSKFTASLLLFWSC